MSGVSKLPKGMTAPAQVNPTLFLSLEPNDYDRAAFDAQTDKMKAIIMASPEWQALQKPQGKPNNFADMPDDIPFGDDEIPF